jgi:tetratricopeptide (TPR) repeat protein
MPGRAGHTWPGASKRLLQLLSIVLLLTLAPVGAAQVKPASGVGEQVCNVQADFFLGLEDYPEAIRLHQQVLARDPQDALAHYHLGFAYGMAGRHREELAEYQRAVQLGLTDWTLFLNLGLAYFERMDYSRAADALTVAEVLAPERSEPHYNLALTYERMRMLSLAEQEALAALALAPRDRDIRNTLAIVLAERGRYAQAREQWNALLADDPEYAPAKANLAILDRARATAGGVAGLAAEALRAFDRRLRQPPEVPAPLVHRGEPAMVLDSEGVSQLKAPQR